MFSLYWLELIIEQTVKVPFVLDVLRIMWHHYDESIYTHYKNDLEILLQWPCPYFFRSSYNDFDGSIAWNTSVFISDFNSFLVLYSWIMIVQTMIVVNISLFYAQLHWDGNSHIRSDMGTVSISHKTSVGPLTESGHKSYGTDYVRGPTSRALNFSESLKFPAIENHAFTQNQIGFDHYYPQKW